MGRIRAILEEARRLGYLGPGDVDAHLGHAESFIAAIGQLEGSAADLGTGGGVPGLILAGHFTDHPWLLLESSRRRSSFLAAAVAGLGWSDRVTVRREAAETAAHDEGLRGSCAAVTARSFGPPSLTAECGAPFLAVGGRLIVSEPPYDEATRWPVEGLGLLGLRDKGQVRQGTSRVRVLEQREPCPPEYARQWRTLQRRPLW